MHLKDNNESFDIISKLKYAKICTLSNKASWIV